ncbi:hypothetical protein L798_02528 [Zootermopsis nevadensis]|uniref:Uncharacterized protein n=1 Tax=Zootermopsis nevadensis TaxID=136037 RepID=A0A067QUN3_ZOONE|nr:hypothetical protein L798_02528 [Zootermopsis nevadensis]
MIMVVLFTKIAKWYTFRPSGTTSTHHLFIPMVMFAEEGLLRRHLVSWVCS